MDILECTNCSEQFRPQDTDVITVRGTAARSREMRQYCPYCHSVLAHEITLGEDELATDVEALGL
jgi:hypothetical protein